MGDFISSLFSTDGLLIGTLLPFIIILTIIVFVHELGHYAVGRWCGIGVKVFSVGFGPELLGFTSKSGTRWRLAIIPLGGYVKFVGDENVTSASTSCDRPRLTESEFQSAFLNKPVWKRALTVAAGPGANFLFSFCVLAIVLWVSGSSIIEPVVSAVQPKSPAERAGFLPGDRFLKMDGEKVYNFLDIKTKIALSEPGQTH